MARALFPEALSNFHQDRPVMNHDNTTEHLIERLKEEVGELQEDFRGNGMTREKYLEQELADILIFAWAAIQSLKVDPDMAIREKIARNMVKYPAHLLQKGTYETQMAECKKQWSKEDNVDFYRQDI